MTLDEAIRHAEEKAKELYCKAGEDFFFDGDWGKKLLCTECAKEHEQLAEWLKDYKRLLEEKTASKWIISEIRCPKCLEYFDPDCYSKEELNKCPNCGADMRGGEENA